MELGKLSDVIWYFRSKNGYAIFHLMNIVWTPSARAMRTLYFMTHHIELGTGYEPHAKGVRQ